MELIADMITAEETADLSIATTSATWADVVAEITRSCARRASEENLLMVPGAVGVLAGASPVVWVHGAADKATVCDALAGSPEVDEVYVTTEQPRLIAALQDRGWAPTDVVPHMTHDLVGGLPAHGTLPAIGALRPADMPEVRDLLRNHGGVEESQLNASYGDDFFTVAAPVWVFGARDEAGRLVGIVAVRRQGRSAMGFALTVDPAWRATGLSTALVAAVVRQAAAIGAEYVHAQASSRSLRCLLESGFTAVGTWQRLVRG